MQWTRDSRCSNVREEDDPDNYDKEDSEIPWYQSVPESFSDAHKTVAAVESFKIDFQARGLQIRNDLGPAATDAAVAAALRGDVEATLQSMSSPAPPPKGEAEAKPPAGQLKCDPYADGVGSSLGNQYHLLSKFSEYKILVAEGKVYPLVAKHFFENIRSRMVSEDRQNQEANPSFRPRSDITSGLALPQEAHADDLFTAGGFASG